MKDKEQAMKPYEAPKVEVIEVEVEKGFANSSMDYEYEGEL